jgi:hypothetical protein
MGSSHAHFIEPSTNLDLEIGDRPDSLDPPEPLRNLKQAAHIALQLSDQSISRTPLEAATRAETAQVIDIALMWRCDEHILRGEYQAQLQKCTID